MKKIIMVLVALIGAQNIMNAQISLGTGVALSYPFTGNANDASGNGHHGVVTGATLTTDRFGNANQAYHFNGSTDFINCGNILNSVFAGVGNKFSISVWVKPDVYMTNNMILAKIADGACSEDQRQFYFRLWNGKVMFGYSSTLYTGNYRYPTGSTSFTNTNKWYHIVVMYDGTVNTGDGIDRVKIYVDGAQETISVGAASTGTVGSIQAGAAPLGVGDYLNTSGTQCNATAFNGKIDDIRIYDRLLNPAEINALFVGSTDVGIAENTDVSACEVYPNPASNGIVNYSITTTSALLSLKVYTVVGTIVYQQQLKDAQNLKGSLDLSAQAPGVYFLQVETAKGTLTKKIVITD